MAGKAKSSKSKSKSVSVEAADVDAAGTTAKVGADVGKEGEDVVMDGEQEEEEEEEDADEGEYEVEKIIDHQGNKGKFVYLVKWKGYGIEHNTWEPEGNLGHATEKMSGYWESKPKVSIKKNQEQPKRGRPTYSAPTSQKKPRTSCTNGANKRSAPADDDEDEQELEVTHVDSMEKYEGVRDWEELVESIDTIERGQGGILLVYMTMTGGEKVSQQTEVAYARCPQKILKFYESHLKWKMADK